MFSNMISQKLQKCNKIDINKYLSGQKKPSLAPPSAIRKQQSRVSVPQTLNNMPSSTSQYSGQLIAHSKKNNQYDLRGILINGGPKMDRPQTGGVLQISKKLLNAAFFQGQIKNKFQIQAEHLIKAPEHNQGQGSIIITCKKMSKFKQDGTKGNGWFLSEQYKDKDLVVTFIFRDKDLIIKGNNVKKSALDKLQQEQIIFKDATLKNSLPGPSITNIVPSDDPGAQKDGQEDVDVIKFSIPTASQLQQTQKFRKNLREMKQQDKITILTDIFKIKKEYQEPSFGDKKKYRCPIFTCQKSYRQITQLKTHMKKHGQLQKNGIQITDYGVLEYSQKSLDFVLALGKMFPSEMKKIIRRMKTKQQMKQ